jgi:hypothetical protein
MLARCISISIYIEGFFAVAAGGELEGFGSTVAFPQIWTHARGEIEFESSKQPDARIYSRRALAVSRDWCPECSRRQQQQRRQDRQYP